MRRVLALAVFVVLFLCAIGSAAFADLSTAHAGEMALSQQAAGLPKIAYGGSAVAFYQSDMTSRMGMLSNPQDDVDIRYEDGNVFLSWIPSNRTVYKGFYLDASIADKTTWNEENFIAAIGEPGDFRYAFSLPSSYCGYAWPVAPITTDERGGNTTQSQYYLCVPSVDNLPESGAGGEAGETPDDDRAALESVHAAIASLPDDPRTILRDTANEPVAAARRAYLALADGLKAQVPDDERMKLARCSIAVLPSDPFKVAEEHRTAVVDAQAVVSSLSESQQRELDSDESGKAVSSSRSYGRYLENAVWALDGLRQVNNVSLLRTGTYSGQVASTSSMGKSNSPRSIAFTVKSVTVEGGRAYAELEHGSNSSQLLRLGGVEYRNMETDQSKNSRFQIPIQLNSTFHFSVKGKGATDDTDAITYEMTTTVDESRMEPDALDSESGSASANGDSGNTSGESGSAAGATSKESGRGSAASSGRTGSANLNRLVSSETGKPSSEGSSSRADETRGERLKGGGESDEDGGSAARRGSSRLSVETTTDSDGIVADGGSVGGYSWLALAGAVLVLFGLGAAGFAVRFFRFEGEAPHA